MPMPLRSSWSSTKLAKNDLCPSLKPTEPEAPKPPVPRKRLSQPATMDEVPVGGTRVMTLTVARNALAP